MSSPEELAREKIDASLEQCGWISRVVTLIPRLRDQQFVTPDDGRKFTELYNVQHLQSAQLDRVSRVCISTIQRLYSILRWFLFWLKIFTARRDRHEETGIPLSEWHEAWHRVENGASRAAATLMRKPKG